MFVKQQAERINFKPFEQTIKSTREKKGLTRKELAAQIRISPRYIASIENSEQTPSLQVFYRLVTCLDMSVDQFFFPEKVIAKTTQRRQLDTLLAPEQRPLDAQGLHAAAGAAGKGQVAVDPRQHGVDAGGLVSLD